VAPSPNLSANPNGSNEGPSQPPKETVASLKDGPNEIALDKSGNVTGVESLPAESRVVVKSALEGAQLNRPDVLDEVATAPASVRGTSESEEPIKIVYPASAVIAETRPLWKSNEALARKYWKKRSFISQGFVVSSPFAESDPPENPIRRLIVGSSLLEKLKAGLRDPEMENTPTDYLNGTDFKIKKTRKGDYNNYDTSEWSRRSRPLTEAEQIAIDQYGLWNLSDFKGARPDAEGIAMIKAMFHASMNGDPFDMAAFGNHYRPWGAGADATNVPDGVDDFTSTPKTNTVPETETLSEVKSGPTDLLNKLRERNTRA